jgi:hypothetical protein
MPPAETFLTEVAEIARRTPIEVVENLCDELVALREREGRLFILGVGGSAGNCGHAVNDFRKLCGIEAYAPTDNVSELTARTNDEGWSTVFAEWLKVGRAKATDTILIFSVWRRQSGAKRQPEPRGRNQGGEGPGPEGVRHRWTRWWLYQAGRRCRGGHSDRGRRPRNAASGGIPGGRLALPRLAPQAAEERDQVVRRAIFLDRDGG